MFSAKRVRMQRSVAADWFYWPIDHLIIWHWSFPVLSGHTEQCGRRQGLTKRKGAEPRNPNTHTKKKEGNVFYFNIAERLWEKYRSIFGLFTLLWIYMTKRISKEYFLLPQDHLDLFIHNFVYSKSQFKAPQNGLWHFFVVFSESLLALFTPLPISLLGLSFVLQHCTGSDTCWLLS